MWATVSDIQDRWVGGDLPATEGVVLQLIEDAETLVLYEFPDLEDRIGDDAGQVPEARVKLVVSRITIRALRNPEGARSRQNGTGPFTEAVTFGGDRPGDLYITDDERAMLGAAGGATRPSAFTIDTTPAAVEGSWTGPDVWTPTP